MKRSKHTQHLSAKILSLVCFAALCCAAAAMVGCSKGSLTDSVAATVNGEKIYESAVTENIENMRALSGLEDDEDWAQALAAQNLTPESYRTQVLEEQIERELLRQEADRLGITADTSYISSTIDKMEEAYGGSDGFLQALQANGYATEEEYQEYLELSSIASQVSSQVLDTITPTQEDLDAAVSAAGTTLSGKRSSHILFTIESDSEADEVTALAESVLQQVKDGGDFAALAQEYSDDSGSASEGGDVGWDCVTSFVTEYQTALDTLNKGELYPTLVESQYGLHIILCTDVYTVPDGGATYDSLPTELQSKVYSTAQTTLRSEAFSDYMVNLRQEADVVVYDMPEGLSYDVDMTSVIDSSTTSPQSEEELEDKVGSNAVLQEGEGTAAVNQS